ncbi:MAG: hypothetical protein II605_02880, partial [Paludibacteraceae bacterium]|nr:hypothetical protein [Paludibacteraceae bacterium]
MKKSIFFVLVAFVLWGCNGSNDRILTSATGSIYECLVVSDPSVQAEIMEVMGGDMYGLPQMEAYFTIAHVSP